MNDSKGTTKVFYTSVFRISIIKIFVLSFFTIVGSCQNLHSQNKDMKFKHLSLEEGLSQSVVTCILQDNRGFMWFGTEDGLNRFDGYEFRVFKSNVENQGSLSNNHVLVIYEDRSGMMWIGTNGGGLNKFDRFREEFTHYKNDPDNPKSLSNNYVRTIYEDRSGILWIGTDGGLNKLEMGNRNIFDAGGEEFTSYKHIPGNTNSISDNLVTSIFEDQSGVIWIGTRNGGLNRFDRKTNKFTFYKNQPGNPNSLSNNTIHAICEDNSGLLWIGTGGGGLNKFIELGTL